jgi:hypothetical protein
MPTSEFQVVQDDRGAWVCDSITLDAQRRRSSACAEQVLHILETLGLTVRADRWTAPPEAEYATFATLVDVTRRRLCLAPERADNLATRCAATAIDENQPPDVGSPGRDRVTLSWPGTAT